MNDWWAAFYEVAGGVLAIVLVACLIAILLNIYERNRL